MSLGLPPRIPPLAVLRLLQVLLFPHPHVASALSQNNTPAKYGHGQVAATSKGAL